MHIRTWDSRLELRIVMAGAGSIKCVAAVASAAAAPFRRPGAAQFLLPLSSSLSAHFRSSELQKFRLKFRVSEAARQAEAFRSNPELICSFNWKCFRSLVLFVMRG